MIKVTNPESCCGCTACASICAHDAITMEPDELGFVYPVVDMQRCTDCSLCESVCAFIDTYDKSLNIMPIAYGARHKDIKEVETSRSGATFVALTDYILEQGGVVYGVGYTDHFRVVHKRAINKEQRDEFKGSKYVQSDLTGIFRQVRKDLQDGFIVAFSGTPCQTAGLNRYIGKRLRKHLFLIDIICHGVPGPYVWTEYLKYVEANYKDKVACVSFRDKSVFGWSAHKESFVFVSGDKIDSSVYSDLFYKHIMLRESCGNCPFCNTERPSDITLADFWGWEKSVPEMNQDDKGVSLVIVNTQKGLDLFSQIQNRMEVKKVFLEDAIQSRMISPSSLHPMRNKFAKDFSKYGFKYVLSKYQYPSFTRKVKNKLFKITNKLFSYVR